MPVDRGGLQYVIQTSGDLSTLDAFRQGLRDARDQMTQLRAEMRGLLGTNANVKKAMQGVGQAAKDTASAYKEVAKASAQITKTAKAQNKEARATAAAEGIRAAALRKYAKALRDAAIAREFANISEERGFKLQSRLLTQAQAQQAAITKVTAVLKKRQVIEETLAYVRQQNLKLTDAELRRLGVQVSKTQKLTVEEKALAAAKERLAKATAFANNAQLQQMRIQEQVLSRRTTAGNNAEIARQLFLMGLDKNGNPLKPTQLTTSATKTKQQAPLVRDQSTARGQIASLLGMKKSADETDKSFRSLAFSIRRILGVYVGLVVIRRTAQAFTDLIKGAIGFNKELESAQLGIAGVLSAVGEVRDAQGRSLDAAQAFAQAQKTAREQVNLLRLDALRTTASLEQLVETFQVALAPGLQAGLGVEQIRNFSVSISQAATAIGLSQNQLAEEIRSILSGSINVRNTRVAAALGITNADIRRAKELGNLADFLNDKFKAFAQVGDELSKTLEGAFNRAQTALSIVAGEASVGLFESLKAVLTDVFDTLVDINAQTGEIKTNPAIVQNLRRIFDGIKDVVEVFRTTIVELNEGALRNVAETAGEIIRIGGGAILGILAGIGNGLAFTLRVVKTIRDILKDILGFDLFDPRDIAGLVSWLTKALIAFTLFKAVIVSTLAIANAFHVAIRVLGIGLRAFSAVVAGTRTIMAATITTARALKVALATTGAGLLILLAGVAADKLGLFDSLSETSETAKAAVKSLTDAFREMADGLPAQIATSIEALKNFDDVIKNLDESAEKLRNERLNLRNLFLVDDSTINLNPIGLSGSVAEQVKNSISAFVDLQERSRNLTKEKNSLESQVQGIYRQQELSRQRISALLGNDVAKVEEFTRKANTLSLLEEDRAASLQRLQELRREPESEDRNANIALHERLLKQIADYETGILNTLSDNADVRQELTTEIGTQWSLAGQLRIAFDGINKIVMAQLDLEGAINNELSERLILSAQAAEFEIKLANATATAELKAAKIRSDARLSPEADRELADAKAMMVLLESQLAVERTKIAVQRQQLSNLILVQQNVVGQAQEAIDFANATEASDEQKARLAQNLVSANEALVALKSQQLALTEQENLATDSITLQIKDQAAIIDELTLKAGSGTGVLFEQITLAVEDLARTLPSQFESIFSIMQSAVTSFSDFVADSIVSAFDPSKKQDIGESFGRFLQSIASQIISTLVQVATVRSLLGLTGLFSGFATGGEVQGFAHGGSVRRPRSHQRRRGFAEGGTVDSSVVLPSAPPGLDSRDRVPVFARVGEWFFPPDSPYADVFPAMLQGLIDPAMLKSLVGTRKASMARVRPGTVQGFAEGGRAGGGAASGGAVATAPGNAGPVPAYIIASDQTAERLFAGGRSAWVRMLEEEGFKRA